MRRVCSCVRVHHVTAEIHKGCGERVRVRCVHTGVVCGPASTCTWWVRPAARGLHSSTSQLNLSRVCHKKTPHTP
jgi:hypothetical protein